MNPRFVFFLLFTPLSALSAATYHVDSRAGDDARDGRSSEARLAHARQGQRDDLRARRSHFAARGQAVWEGVALHPLGSGTAAAPIVIDREGEGPRRRFTVRGKCPGRLGSTIRRVGKSRISRSPTSAQADRLHQRGIEIRAKGFRVGASHPF